jgi:hypothetical protein
MSHMTSMLASIVAAVINLKVPDTIWHERSNYQNLRCRDWNIASIMPYSVRTLKINNRKIDDNEIESNLKKLKQL